MSFGFVSAQLQGFSNVPLRQRPMIGTIRRNSKILAPNGYSISSNALENQGRDVKAGRAAGGLQAGNLAHFGYRRGAHGVTGASRAGGVKRPATMGARVFRWRGLTSAATGRDGGQAGTRICAIRISAAGLRPDKLPNVLSTAEGRAAPCPKPHSSPRRRSRGRECFASQLGAATESQEKGCALPGTDGGQPRQ